MVDPRPDYRGAANPTARLDHLHDEPTVVSSVLVIVLDLEPVLSFTEDSRIGSGSPITVYWFSG
jgi:hypothetical protein